MIEQPKNDKEEKLGLFCKIIVSDSTQLFNKTKIIKEYSILLNENYPFLVLKRNLKSFAIMKEQPSIKPDEDLIFEIKIKSDSIELLEFNQIGFKFKNKFILKIKFNGKTIKRISCRFRLSFTSK